MPLIQRLQRSTLLLQLVVGLSAAFGVASLALSQPLSATKPPPEVAESPVPLNLRVIGGLADVSQFTQQEAPFWNTQLAKLSHGRYSASIVPFDRAGVPGSEMLRLMQLGVVPFGTVIMSSLTGAYPQYTAPDLAGLNLDIAQLRTSVAAFRPYLQKALREEQGVEMLGIYIYPAQMVFCNKPMSRLADLKGRRVRVSSASQADFVSALGAIPVHTAFAQIASRLESGSVDCAITGTLSGSSIGLQRLVTDLHQLPINWGMAIFGANRAAWLALPEDLRALLSNELPKLESRIWNESVSDTTKGLDCLSGKALCADGKTANVKLSAANADDRHQAEKIFTDTVLPGWLRRCGGTCAAIWSRTIGLERPIALPKQ